MKRLSAGIAVLALGALGLSLGAGSASAAPVQRTPLFITGCQTGFEDPSYRFEAGGRVLLAHAKVFSDVYYYDRGAWKKWGTEQDMWYVENNFPAGIENLHGTFAMTDETGLFGNFAGTLTYHERGSEPGFGQSEGRSTSGTGALLRNLGSVDASSFSPLPACAASVTELLITTP